MANLVDDPGTVTCRHRRILRERNRWPDQLIRTALDYGRKVSGAWSDFCQALSAKELSLAGMAFLPRIPLATDCCPFGNGGVICEGLSAHRGCLSNRRPLTSGPAATVITRPGSAEGVRPFNTARGEECGLRLRSGCAGKGVSPPTTLWTENPLDPPERNESASRFSGCKCT